MEGMYFHFMDKVIFWWWEGKEGFMGKGNL